MDLLVIGDVDEKRLIQAVKDLERQLQREVNYTFHSKGDWISRAEDALRRARNAVPK